MTNISTAMLNNCDFEGEIDETFMAENWLVAGIDLSHNRFTSPNGIPATLLERPYLEVLDLSANLLSGPFPSEIQIVPEESYFNFLSVYDNKLTGQIPSDLAKFPLLDHIDVSNNRLTGVMPNWLGQMTQIGFLFLSLNPFTPGPVPESFANFTFLQELSMRVALPARVLYLPSLVRICPLCTCWI
jgi:Leucine-rich repeat (LRR) protein